MAGIQMRFLSGMDIEALELSNEEVLTAVEEVLTAQGEGSVVLDPRAHLVPRGSRGHFNLLRCSLDKLGLAAVKVVGDFLDNYQLGLPSEMALILVLDSQTGVPVGIVDGTWITEARTGAVTALGAKYLARPDSKVLGHVGARGTAWWNIVLLDHLFDFDEIRVASRRPESRSSFANRLSEHLGKRVVAVDSIRECVDQADIIVEATRLERPEVLIPTQWIRSGTFMVPYGTVSAVDINLLDVFDKVVVDDWGQATVGPFGSLRRHVDEGILTPGTLYAELGQIVAGLKPGRETPEERTLLWHRGLATTDLALAKLALAKAQSTGLGVDLDYR